MKQQIIQLLNIFRLNRIYSTELKGKVILVTGATGGLGKAVVNEILNKGAHPIVVGRDINKLTKEFHALKNSITMLPADVTNEADVDTIFRHISTTHGKLDALINCVGVFADSDIDMTSVSDYERVFDANFRSIFLTSKAAVKIMKRRKSGVIINIGSRISRNSNMAPRKMLYASSKYALEGYSIALSKSVAKDHIRVICLLPATMSTFLTKDFFKYMIPERVARIVSFIIEMDDIDFDPIAFKSVCQNI